MKPLFRNIATLILTTILCTLSISHVFATAYHYVNTVPIMVSNTSPAGVAFGEGSSPGQEPYKAFDGVAYYHDYNGYHAWGTSQTRGILGYEFQTSKVISSYALSYNDPVGDYLTNKFTRPSQWTFEAWDNSKWIVLDTQNVTNWLPSERKVFEISNRLPYKKYRINITNNGGSRYGAVNLQVQELELLETPIAYVLNLESEKSKIKKNELVNVNLSIDNITEIAAEDIRIKYNSELVEFMGYKEMNGIKLVKADNKTGELRFILASKGKSNVITKKEILLNLQFKGLKVGEALLEISKGRVSDGIEMERDLSLDECGKTTLLIEALKDVNNSGEFTLLDLAIDARHMNENPLGLPQYNTDIAINNAIDENDLLEIGNLMLNNSNYTF